tara:strand:+ start:6751 stop:7077 length:327 start_codon:yes stop_codon:yes gene_type:complete
MKTTTTISLKKDLGISKNAIRIQIDRFAAEVGTQDERWESAMDAMTILKDRGDICNLDEAELLISWYVSSHDECVWENEEDYSALEAFQAIKKIERQENAMKILETLR